MYLQQIPFFADQTGTTPLLFLIDLDWFEYSWTGLPDEMTGFVSVTLNSNCFADVKFRNFRKAGTESECNKNN